MQIYRIAKVIIEDPKLMEAAHKVVDEGKMIRDVLADYHVNPDKLSDAVMDLRKMKSLPVDLILQEYDKSTGVRGVERSLKRLNTPVSLEDIVWVMRRKRPNLSIRIIPSEVKKIIELKEQGKTSEEIENEMRISHDAITNVLKKHNPNLVKTPRPKSLGDNIYSEYIDLTTKQEKSHEEAMEILRGEHSVSTSDILGYLTTRGLSFGNAPRPLTQEEIDKVLEMARGGKKAGEIAKEMGRHENSINKMIRKYDPELYDKIRGYTCKNLPLKVKEFIFKSLNEGKTYRKISDEVKELFDINVGYMIIRGVKELYSELLNAPAPTSTVPEQTLTPQIPRDTLAPQSIPFGSLSVNPLKEELVPSKGRILTDEEVEQMRKRLEEKMRGSFAFSNNWYRRAQRFYNENL